jgi:hypothetical protein
VPYKRPRDGSKAVRKKNHSDPEKRVDRGQIEIAPLLEARPHYFSTQAEHDNPI